MRATGKPRDRAQKQVGVKYWSARPKIAEPASQCSKPRPRLARVVVEFGETRFCFGDGLAKPRFPELASRTRLVHKAETAMSRGFDKLETLVTLSSAQLEGKEGFGLSATL